MEGGLPGNGGRDLSASSGQKGVSTVILKKRTKVILGSYVILARVIEGIKDWGEKRGVRGTLLG